MSGPTRDTMSKVSPARGAGMVMGAVLDGGMADEMIVPERSLVRLPAGVVRVVDVDGRRCGPRPPPAGADRNPRCVRRALAVFGPGGGFWGSLEDSAWGDFSF